MEAGIAAMKPVKRTREAAPLDMTTAFYRNFSKPLYKARTLQGTILYLAKSIPCQCLALPARHFSQKIEKVGSCSHCQKEQWKDLLGRCGRCLNNQYCSEDCKDKDWDFHQFSCRKHAPTQVKTKQEEEQVVTTQDNDKISLDNKPDETQADETTATLDDEGDHLQQRRAVVVANLTRSLLEKKNWIDDEIALLENDKKIRNREGKTSGCG